MLFALQQARLVGVLARLAVLLAPGLVRELGALLEALFGISEKQTVIHAAFHANRLGCFFEEESALLRVVKTLPVLDEPNQAVRAILVAVHELQIVQTAALALPVAVDLVELLCREKQRRQLLAGHGGAQPQDPVLCAILHASELQVGYKGDLARGAVLLLLQHECLASAEADQLVALI